MAVRLTDVKTGQEKGVSYSDQEVGRMTKRTAPIKGSIYRKTTGLDKAIKLQGRRVSGKARRDVMSAVKQGGGGFTRLARSGT